MSRQREAASRLRSVAWCVRQARLQPLAADILFATAWGLLASRLELEGHKPECRAEERRVVSMADWRVHDSRIAKGGK